MALFVFQDFLRDAVGDPDGDGQPEVAFSLA